MKAVLGGSVVDWVAASIDNWGGPVDWVAGVYEAAVLLVGGQLIGWRRQ